MNEWDQFESVAASGPDDWHRVRPKLQLELEAYERWADWNDARVEFVRAYLAKDGFKFARAFERSAQPPDHHPHALLLLRDADPVLLNRLAGLDEGLNGVFSAANAYLSPSIRNLGFLSGKFWGFNFGRVIVFAANLFESFLWPGRQQWRYEQLIERQTAYRKLIDAFRRDYLTG